MSKILQEVSNTYSIYILILTFQFLAKQNASNCKNRATDKHKCKQQLYSHEQSAVDWLNMRISNRSLRNNRLRQSRSNFSVQVSAAWYRKKRARQQRFDESRGRRRRRRNRRRLCQQSLRIAFRTTAAATATTAVQTSRHCQAAATAKQANEAATLEKPNRRHCQRFGNFVSAGQMPQIVASKQFIQNKWRFSQQQWRIPNFNHKNNFGQSVRSGSLGHW